jgi:hypothetical protein
VDPPQIKTAHKNKIKKGMLIGVLGVLVKKANKKLN